MKAAGFTVAYPEQVGERVGHLGQREHLIEPGGRGLADGEGDLLGAVGEVGVLYADGKFEAAFFLGGAADTPGAVAESPGQVALEGESVGPDAAVGGEGGVVGFVYVARLEAQG